MNKLCLALLIAFAVPSLASAGGGNTKSTGTITFKNHSTTDTVYLIMSASEAVVSGTTIETFPGIGRTLAPGESTSYTSLKGGKYFYGFLASRTAPTTLAGAVRRNATVAGGQTLNIKLP